jgi:dipeptidyl aminopeptidase/acylaminoacyl peptidase
MRMWIKMTVFFTLIFQKVEAQQYLIRSDKGLHTLYKLDYKGGSENKISYSPDSKFIYIAVSPDKKFISATLAKKNRNNLNDYHLIILDKYGKEWLRINKNVQRYEWSPDGAYLMFITGEDREEGIGFLPDGLYILNVSTKEIQEISFEGFHPYRLHWLQTDDENSGYMRAISSDPELKIVKYNINKRRFEKTEAKGIHFSPDGE